MEQENRKGKVRQARQVWRLSYHIDKINNLEKNSKMEDEVYEKKRKKKKEKRETRTHICAV